MKRRTRIVLLLPLLLLGSIGMTAHWLLATEGGARWLWSRLGNTGTVEIAAQSLSGNLRDGLNLRGLLVQGETFELTVGSCRVQASPSWRPFGIVVHALEAGQAELQLRETGQASRSLEDILSGLSLSWALDVRQATIGPLSVRRGVRLLVADGALQLSGRWGSRLEGLKLALETPQWTATAEGELELVMPWRHAAKGSWRRPSAPLGPAGMTFSLAGDGQTSQLEAEAQDGEFKASAVLRELFGAARFTAQASGREWPLQADPAGARLAEFTAQAQGTLEAWEILAEGRVGLPSIPDTGISLAGSGDLQGLEFEQLELESAALSASGSGNFAWSPGPAMDLQLQLQRGSPEVWLPEWPEEQPLNGHLDLAWRGAAFDIREARLGLAGSAAEARAHGSWDPDSGLAEGLLEWHHLAWPVGAAKPQISSEHGSWALGGSPDAWTFDGRFDFQSQAYPAGAMSASGEGSRSHAQLRELEGALLGGAITGTALLDWANAFEATAELSLRGVQLGELWPDWPMRLDGGMHLAYQVEPWSLRLATQGLDARWQGRTLKAQGSMALGGQGARFERFTVTEPGSRLLLDGSWRPGDTLRFDLDIQPPGLLSELLGASASGAGSLAFAGEQPVLEGEIRGRNGRWGDTEVEAFALHSRAGEELEAELSGLLLGGVEVSTATATVRGPLNDQQLSLALDLGTGQLVDQASLLARGSLSDWRDPDRWQWRGTLQSLSLARGGESFLALDDAVPLRFGASDGRLDEACLAAPSGGRLCASTDWRQDGGFSLAGQLRDWPLGTLMQPLLAEVEFSQQLNGRFDWSQAPGKPPSGQAALALSAGQFGPADDPETRVATGPGQFGFELDEGELRAGRLELEFVGRGRAEVDWGVEALVLDGTGRLHGRARIEALDLSVLESLWPQVDRIGGRFDADLELGGSVSDPRFDGDFSLRDAGLSWTMLAVTVQDLEVQGRVTPDDQLVFKGPFMMGAGTGTVQGFVDFADPAAPAWSVDVEGQGLRIANLPTLQVDADPKIQVAWRESGYALSGDITIPNARIAPSGEIFSRVAESADVRVVAGAAESEVQTEELRPVNLEGSLKVALGDEVRLQMQAVDAGLSGKITLDWAQDLVPTAKGLVRVNGEVRVFGPLLNIDDGRVRFAGGPVNDPALNIRAVRDIYGNTQIHTAGVMVSGTATRPLIEAYTNPLTTRERAWALLITGQDFEYGQGVGAFDIGTYIAPRLYISYGVSLFDDANVVSARYDLRRGFGIKATSSQTENGLDISYTLTRGPTGESQPEPDSEGDAP